MGRLVNSGNEQFKYQDSLGQTLERGDMVMLALSDGGLVRRKVSRITAAGVWVGLPTAPEKSMGKLARHSNMVKINILLNHIRQ